MRPRAWLGTGLILAWVATASLAGAAAPAASAPTKATTKATASKAPATQGPATRAASGKTPASKAPAAKSAPDAAPAAGERAASPKSGKARAGEAPRTLQDIHIEGEIPVPQVLFITARDQRRFLDFQHRRYLKTSQQIGEQAVFPSWIGVTESHRTDDGKETPR